MTKQLRIALYLPTPDIEALLKNQTILAMSRMSLRPGREFALYPVNFIADRAQKEYYKPDFLETANEVLKQPAADTISLKSWAKCEKCEIFSNLEELKILPQLTIWTKAALENTLSHSSYLFLAYLRVYELPEAIAYPSISDAENKLGKIAGLSQPLAIANSHPVFDDEAFSQECKRIETRQIPAPLQPQEKDLDRLLDEGQTNFPHSRTQQPKTMRQNETDPRDRQSIVNPFDFIPTPPKPKPVSSDSPISPPSNPAIASPTPPVSPPPQPAIAPPITSIKHENNDLEWIDNIVKIGNSSNGHEFERLVRKSLIFLGFSNSNENSKASLDPETTGGSGGLDFYAEKPYPVVGECKATKTEKVPSKTAGQLIELGYKILPDCYESCIKIIFAAGELTSHTEQTTLNHKMNVIRPETLEKLVQLKAAFPGTIDLLTFKTCLEREPFGEAADTKVNEYCDRILAELKIRSQFVEIVKQTKQNLIEFVALKGIYTHLYSSYNLNEQQMYNILIELSSPLTGYLGREKGKEWRGDRFYFLRDLPVENSY
ncbi:MAG: DUF1802 family protein [Cyanobacteria bacterium SBLK]|nr:DUF1802 family protein [Cyanobacteria bacterium SBLK]